MKPKPIVDVLAHFEIDSNRFNQHCLSMKHFLLRTLSEIGMVSAERHVDQSRTIYDIEVNDIGGKRIQLSEFQGKVLLVVNVASNCGFTYQYETLEALFQKYREQGLVILGFPCNQFGGQEPGSSEEIISFCKMNYGVTFPIFEKGLVKGQGKQPIFKFLTETANPALTGEILWNFEKFLINRTGHLVDRFRSVIKPDSTRFENRIKHFLN